MKDKILKFELEAEKLADIKSVRGGGLCCIGGPNDQCICTDDTDLFKARFDVWLERMDRLLVPTP